MTGGKRGTTDPPPDGATDEPAPPTLAASVPPGAMPPAGRKRRRWRATLAVLGLLLLLGGFAAFVREALQAAPAPDGETDAIVVLTGGSERVATGFRLLVEDRAPRLLISGAYPEADLAEIAAAAGHDPAAFAGRVAVGHAAASTRGNAAEVAAWARAEEMRTLRIVTAGYHMPRAMLELRRAMPTRTLVPHPVPSALLRAPDALWRPKVWLLLAGEYARYLAARAGLSGLLLVPRREAPAA
ncbi:YdcF family protein [Roseomonas sp. HF4]|uniref:YdcF family protein n=1 Tax=Roseomonas sp. HF4 TaxID=2562313 RepID=UPI001F0E4520|nr:YdcF family protein [Roseomonas sp. HF4]